MGEENITSNQIEHPGRLLRIAATAQHILQELHEGTDGLPVSYVRESVSRLQQQSALCLNERLRAEMMAICGQIPQTDCTPFHLRIYLAGFVGWLEGMWQMAYAVKLTDSDKAAALALGWPPEAPSYPPPAPTVPLSTPPVRTGQYL